MKITRTEIPDLLIIEPTVFGDERGWFMESFNQARWEAALREAGLPVPPPFVQDNHSCSHRGVLRGMHWQLPPHTQGKLMRVVKGAIFDVAVDVRRGSPTFGRWVGVDLSATNRRQFWIPAGFAHGFLALEDDTQVQYKTTGYYCQKSERNLAWDDPTIGIAWPLFKVPHPLRIAPKDVDSPRLEFADVFAADAVIELSGS